MPHEPVEQHRPSPRPSIALRLATPQDSRPLFRWRNDELTRAMFKHGDPVPWKDHVAWLERRLSQPQPNLFIAEENGVPVGTIRVDEDNSLSYTVAPEHRGRGIAARMLRLVRERFGPLTAEIHPENVGSIRAAERAGHRVVLLPG